MEKSTTYLLLLNINLVAYYNIENKSIYLKRGVIVTIINLFCDASIDIDRKIACGGCFITMQDSMGVQEIGSRLILQTDATNNSSEILAIWAGVVEALKLRNQFPGAVFRLFSDSKISLYGVRDWIKNWIQNTGSDGILMSSSGTPVKNQQRFIDIYNMIVENNLRIEFYHQRGHVNEGRVPINVARAQVIRANKVPPEGLGLDIEYICHYNDMIDNLTRDAVRNYDQYLITGCPPGVDIESEIPIIWEIRRNQCHQYIRCIDKASIRSRHDFKGGYNQ